MCKALYLASDRPLPLTRQPQFPQDLCSATWPNGAQPFHTALLKPAQEVVRSHFRHPHVLYAGSYEGCACGFNYGREHPESESDPNHLAAARESMAALVQYILENNVLEVYSCWMDDEAKPPLYRWLFKPRTLASAGFIFQDRELLTIEHGV
jgi:hypothetical protein